MYARRKSFLWTLTVMVVVASLLLPWVVLADQVVNTIDTTVDPALEVREITVGSSTAVGFYIKTENNIPPGDANGCNATGSAPATVNLSVPSQVSASSTSLTFTGCGEANAITVMFSSSVVGDYTISVASVTGGRSGSLWETAPAAFTLRVVPPSDTTPPVITYSITGTKGNGDWYVSDVFVDWTVTDPESEVTILEGCEDTLIDYDTTGATLICRASSAGGTSQASVTIQRDATPPTVTVAPDRDPDQGSWYNAPVVFSVSGSDATSGLAGCADGGTYSGPDSASASFSASCWDNAGNSGSGSYEFQYDATVPDISGSAAPAANSYGWNNTDVAVTFTCSDATSGIASCGPDATLTGEGADQYVTGAAVDNAGNRASATVGPISIDKTPPTVTAAASPAPNAYGWNNTDVTVSFSGVDALSGIAACDPAVVLSGEGAGQSATGSCTDRADNSASATASGINIDKTPPTITWSNGPVDGGIYYFGFVPAAPTCTASDDLSGPNGCTVSGYGNAIGTHTMTATAYDKAGNVKKETRTYTVQAWTLSGFYQPVDMGGVWNTVKGGSTVPLKFEIFAGPTELADTAYVKSFTAVQISCTGSGGEDEVEFTTTGGTVLRYDPVAGQFIQNWQTPKRPGTCYRVTMTTQDGSSLVALFRLR